MHTMKLSKADSKKVTMHDKRDRDSRSSESKIDPTKTHLNYAIQQIDDNRMNEVFDMAKRKDAITMISTILTLPPELQYASRAEQIRFFIDADKAMNEAIGGEPAGSYIHFDETTPHLHKLTYPITKDGRLCAKEVCNRNMLRNLHPSVTKAVQGKGWNVTLYEENDIEREAKHERGDSKRTMHNFRTKAAADGARDQYERETEKLIGNYQQALKHSKRNVKRQKGEDKDEYKERKKDFVEIPRTLYNDFMALKADLTTAREKIEQEKALEALKEAEKKQASEVAEAQRFKQHYLEQKRQEEVLIEQKSEQKANEKVREAMQGQSTSYTKRLEEYCASVKYQDGTSVLDGFHAKEKELQKQINRNRGYSR